MKSILQTCSIVNICSVDKKKKNYLTKPSMALDFDIDVKQHRGRKTSQILRCLVTSVHSPYDNKVPDRVAWLGQTWNTIIQKYSPKYPDQEKRSRKAYKDLYPPLLLYCLFLNSFLWHVLMRLYLHFSEVIRIAFESLSMYHNIHIV